MKHQIIATRQQLKVSVQTDGAPVTDNWNGATRFQPSYLHLSYNRHSHAPGRWDVYAEAGGPRILASGLPSIKTTVTATWSSHRDRQHVPEWVRELMEAYRPHNTMEHEGDGR